MTDSTPDARSRGRRILVGCAAAAGAAAFLFFVYLGLTWDLRAAELEPPAAFESARVIRGPLYERVIATGTMEPFARLVVQSEIPGIVARVLVDDGDRVARGEPLVELYRDRLEDRVAQLRATLRERQAIARYDLEGRARATVDKARSDLTRGEKLHARGVLAEEALEDFRHAVRLAKIDLTDAGAEAAARRASVEHATNALSRAERDLEKSVIRSSVDGIVVRRKVEVGSAVADIQNGGTEVAVLADDRRIHLLAEVDENDVAQLRVSQAADVTIDAFPDERFEGRVRKISSSGISEGAVSHFEVEIEIEPDERIRVGMSADARILVREHTNALLVPNTAIVRTPEGAKVRVSSGDDDFQLVSIHEVVTDGFQTAVDDGLAEGDLVLVRAGR